MFNFIKYILRYWTHYQILSVKKSFITDNQIYTATATFKKLPKPFKGGTISDVVFYKDIIKTNDGNWHYLVDTKDFESIDGWIKKKYQEKK